MDLRQTRDERPILWHKEQTGDLFITTLGQRLCLPVMIAGVPVRIQLAQPWQRLCWRLTDTNCKLG